MKSNKAFICLMIALFIVKWAINILLSNGIYNIVSFAEIIPIAILGTLIMYISLTLNDFKTFAVIYGFIWGIWIVLSLLTYTIPTISFSGKQIHTFRIVEYFSGMTLLYTPLPFLLFWVFIRSIKLIK